MTDPVEPTQQQPALHNYAGDLIILTTQSWDGIDMAEMGRRFYNELRETAEGSVPEELTDPALREQAIREAMVDRLNAGFTGLDPENPLPADQTSRLAGLIMGSSSAEEFGTRFDEQRSALAEMLLLNNSVQVFNRSFEAQMSIGDALAGFPLFQQMAEFFSGGRDLDPRYEAYYEAFDAEGSAFDNLFEMYGGHDDTSSDPAYVSYGRGGMTMAVAELHGVELSEVQSIMGPQNTEQRAAFFASNGTAESVFVNGEEIPVDFRHMVLPQWEENGIVGFGSEEARTAFCEHLAQAYQEGARTPDELSEAMREFAAGRDDIAMRSEGPEDRPHDAPTLIENAPPEPEPEPEPEPVSAAGALAFLAGESRVGPFVENTPDAAAARLASVPTFIELTSQPAPVPGYSPLADIVPPAPDPNLLGPRLDMAP